MSGYQIRNINNGMHNVTVGTVIDQLGNNHEELRLPAAMYVRSIFENLCDTFRMTPTDQLYLRPAHCAIEAQSGEIIPPDPFVFRKKVSVKTPNYLQRVRAGEIIANTGTRSEVTVEFTPSPNLPVTNPAGIVSPPLEAWVSYDSRFFMYGGWQLSIEWNGYRVWITDASVKRVRGNYYPFTSSANESKALDLYAGFISAAEHWNVPPDFFQACVNKADEGAIDFLTELAEFPQTLKSVWDLLRQIFRIYKDAKRGEIDIMRKRLEKTRVRVKLHKKLTEGKPSRYEKREIIKEISNLDREIEELLNGVADLWLQWRYEMVPTVKTIEAISYVANNLAVAYERYRTRHEGIPIDIYFNDVDGPVQALLTLRVFLKHQYDITSVARDLARHLTFNLPLTMWELVPRSFIVDWFIPVGNFLAMLRPKPAIQEVGGYSMKYETSFSFVLNDGQHVNISPRTYRFVASDIRANAYPMIWDPNINLLRTLDAIALAWPTMLKGLRSTY